MDFGLVLQCDPPARDLVAMARRAEDAGFSHVWTFDSHILWQEPFVIYPRLLDATDHVRVGPMVTNPLTRDVTVVASLFATLNEMFGPRTVCGIGRGDSAVRVGGRRPATLARFAEAIGAIKHLAAGEAVEIGGTEVRIPWIERSATLPVWAAGYGPRVLEIAGRLADGCIVQLADPELVSWCAGIALAAREGAGLSSAGYEVCAAAPAYIGGDRARQRDQLRWFGGMVGNHVEDLVSRYGAAGGLPAALVDYIENRPGYDYAHHGRAGNASTEFVPDETVERFCVLGGVEDHIEKLTLLQEAGVTQFALYLMHDAADATLAAYGEHVIPHFRARQMV